MRYIWRVLQVLKKGRRTVERRHLIVLPPGGRLMPCRLRHRGWQVGPRGASDVRRLRDCVEGGLPATPGDTSALLCRCPGSCPEEADRERESQRGFGRDQGGRVCGKEGGGRESQKERKSERARKLSSVAAMIGIACEYRPSSSIINWHKFKTLSRENEALLVSEEMVR